MGRLRKTKQKSACDKACKICFSFISLKLFVLFTFDVTLNEFQNSHRLNSICFFEIVVLLAPGRNNIRIRHRIQPLMVFPASVPAVYSMPQFILVPGENQFRIETVNGALMHVRIIHEHIYLMILFDAVYPQRILRISPKILVSVVGNAQPVGSINYRYVV